MRRIKLFKDRKGEDLVPYVKSGDSRHEVVAPVSSVRIGETSRELVKQGEAVDLTKWVTVHVTNSQRQAKKWLDTNAGYVLRLSTPYEVA